MTYIKARPNLCKVYLGMVVKRTAETTHLQGEESWYSWPPVWLLLNNYRFICLVKLKNFLHKLRHWFILTILGKSWPLFNCCSFSKSKVYFGINYLLAWLGFWPGAAGCKEVIVKILWTINAWAGADVVTKFIHSATRLCWNKALTLDFPNHMTIRF